MRTNEYTANTHLININNKKIKIFWLKKKSYSFWLIMPLILQEVKLGSD